MQGIYITFSAFFITKIALLFSLDGKKEHDIILIDITGKEERDMPAFDQMTLTELIRPAGYDCACGKHHSCPMDYLKIGPGAIRETAAMVKAMGCEKPFVVCDQNTYEAAGKQVEALLTEAGISHVLYIIPCAGQKIAPAQWEVGSVIMHYDPSCDLILGVGSGVVNDICKVVSLATGIPNVQIFF